MRGGRSFLAALPLFLVLLGGCTVPEAVMGPEGRLAILGPDPTFDPLRPTGGWVVDGTPANGAVAVEHDANGRVLAFQGGGDAFILARRTKALAAATPFLSWRWRLDPFDGGRHPLNLIVGFHGGAAESPSRGAMPLVWSGAVLPPYDRVMVIGWDGDGAAPTVDAAAPRLGRAAVGRGGAGTGGWRDQAVDLVRLYAELWPDDDRRRIAVTFIGLSLAARQPGQGRVADIVLGR